MTAVPFKRSKSRIWAINSQLLGTALCAFASWVLWPSSYEWWGFGLLSIIMALGSILGLHGAIKAMSALYERDKMIADYEDLGGAPKSSRMASEDQLRDAGMLHD